MAGRNVVILPKIGNFSGSSEQAESFKDYTAAAKSSFS